MAGFDPLLPLLEVQFWRRGRDNGMPRHSKTREARRKRDRLEHARRQWEHTLDRSMEQLDGDIWSDPGFDSYVVQTCLALRKKPIRSLSDEELRLAVGQQIGLEWLVRLALERLREDPLRSGDFYPGDLLQNVLRVPSAFWPSHKTEHEELRSIITALEHDNRRSDLPPGVRSAMSAFAVQR